VRLLLDTHSFLWFAEGDARLSPDARTLIQEETNDLWLSVAALWEIAIKVSIGKLRLEEPFETLIPRLIHENEIALLGITLSHAAVVAALPHHHRDPFDRLMVAQAQVEQIPMVSNDPALDAYGVTRLW
jgi:PIN domain nuclease of toxin-antitoxin system